MSGTCPDSKRIVDPKDDFGCLITDIIPTKSKSKSKPEPKNESIGPGLGDTWMPGDDPFGAPNDDPFGATTDDQVPGGWLPADKPLEFLQIANDLPKVLYETASILNTATRDAKTTELNGPLVLGQMEFFSAAASWLLHSANGVGNPLHPIPLTRMPVFFIQNPWIVGNRISLKVTAHLIEKYQEIQGTDDECWSSHIAHISQELAKFACGVGSTRLSGRVFVPPE